ncbi:hypothetical protein XENOCAPTIV_019427 [Xenoophorus captivus]|uniref:Uncharacterized protein n=1 Tax=Xenoophorus captivus TaxID=1517983 RepID=A0ABV0R5W6_9TELE
MVHINIRLASTQASSAQTLCSLASNRMHTHSYFIDLINAADVVFISAELMESQAGSNRSNSSEQSSSCFSEMLHHSIKLLFSNPCGHILLPFESQPCIAWGFMMQDNIAVLF